MLYSDERLEWVLAVVVIEMQQQALSVGECRNRVLTPYSTIVGCVYNMGAFSADLRTI